MCKLSHFINHSLLVLFFLSSTYTSVCYASKELKVKTNDFRDTIPADTLMKDAASLAAAVYSNTGGEEIKTAWPTGYKDVGFIDTSDGTKVWILKKSGVLTIAFGGTDEHKDWYTNLDIDREQPKMQGAEGKVLSGFQESLFKPLDKITVYSTKTQEVKELKNAVVATELENILTRENLTTKLTVTGHSLGGALSMVMASYMAAKYPDLKVTMITFGAPRVGSYDWKDWANSVKNLRMFRYSYNSDGVARIPPPPTYHHAGHTIWIKQGQSNSNKNRSYIYYRHDGCSAAGEDTKKFCEKNKLKSKPMSWNLLGGKSISDHDMQKYKKALNEGGPRFLPNYFENKL